MRSPCPVQALTRRLHRVGASSAASFCCPCEWSCRSLPVVVIAMAGAALLLLARDRYVQTPWLCLAAAGPLDFTPCRVKRSAARAVCLCLCLRCPRAWMAHALRERCYSPPYSVVGPPRVGRQLMCSADLSSWAPLLSLCAASSFSLSPLYFLSAPLCSDG